MMFLSAALLMPLFFMAISRTKKESVVRELDEALNGAKIVIFTDFQGTNVAALNELRNKVRESGGVYRVAKKRLLARVLAKRGVDGIDPRTMEGEIAVALGMQDSAATSKAVYEAQQAGETIKIISGIMDEQLLSREDIIQLATLPSRQELLARMVGSMSAPLTGMVRVLEGNIRGLVYALHAISEQKS